MQEHTHNTSIFRIVVAVLDAVMIAYIGSYFYWAFIAGTAGSGFLPGLFEAINPITTGAYLSGAIVLLHLSAYRNVLALPGCYSVSVHRDFIRIDDYDRGKLERLADAGHPRHSPCHHCHPGYCYYSDAAPEEGKVELSACNSTLLFCLLYDIR